MDLTMAKVTPLLAKPPSAAQTPRVEGWLAGLKVLLDNRYGDKLTSALEPLFLVFVADALQRRLDKLKQMIDSEGAGPFSARWNPASSLGAWFLQGELDEMDSVTGGGGTRTYRTAAPDGVRFGNLSRCSIWEEEGIDVPFS